MAAMRPSRLSACAYHRLLKLARTGVDPALSDSMEVQYFVEALQYRPPVRE
jgi:predicted ATPase with chaperone activity